MSPMGLSSESVTDLWNRLLEIQRELERTLVEIGEMKERMDGVFGEEEGEIYLVRSPVCDSENCVLT